MSDRVKALLMTIISIPLVFIIFGVLIFIPANDIYWSEGWIFVIMFLIYVFLYFLYFLITDPVALLKRAKYTTDDPDTQFLPDKTFMVLALPVFVFIMIFPGIQHSQNIPPFPWIIEFFGFIGLFLSLVFVTYVNAVNKYASKGLVIHKDHELITSGPYRFVRHPMYLGIAILSISLPIALGSFIASIVSILFPILLIYRIGIEEKLLLDHLAGYQEYMQQVKYRLIPKIY